MTHTATLVEEALQYMFFRKAHTATILCRYWVVFINDTYCNARKGSIAVYIFLKKAYTTTLYVRALQYYMFPRNKYPLEKKNSKVSCNQNTT